MEEIISKAIKDLALEAINRATEEDTNKEYLNAIEEELINAAGLKKGMEISDAIRNVIETIGVRIYKDGVKLGLGLKDQFTCELKN